jgi:predicted metalloendopeptidase
MRSPIRGAGRALGRLSVVGLPGPIGGYVEADAGDPTQMALYLFQGGTALPDRDYYLKDDARFSDIRAKYVEYLTKVFTLAGRRTLPRTRRPCSRSKPSWPHPVDAG